MLCMSGDRIKIVLKKYLSFIILLMILFLFSCEYRYLRIEDGVVVEYIPNPRARKNEKEIKDNASEQKKEKKEEKEEIKNIEFRKKIVNIAYEVKDLYYLNYKGLYFNYDCSGLVNYVFFKAGINLLNYRVKGYRTGVQRLFRLGEKYFHLSKIKGYIGDVILFNNTYDYNCNGVYDDILTHTAIIVDFNKKTNTYKFVHIISSGWRIGYMNLTKRNIHKENGVIYNSFLRRNDTMYLTTPLYYLASNMFDNFLNIIDYVKNR